MTDLSHVKEFGSLVVGDKVLITVDTFDHREVDRIQDILVERFPGVEFTILAGPVEVKVMSHE